MKKFVTRSVVIVAGLLTVPTVTRTQVNRTITDVQSDFRLVLLKRFFTERDCPAARHADEFIKAADKNDLDWRLLPSIALVESGAGKDYKNNNILGWDSARQKFPSVPAGIHAVAHRLANSKLYKDKTVYQILRTYNASAAYATKVMGIMRSIGPEPSLAMSVNY